MLRRCVSCVAEFGNLANPFSMQLVEEKGGDGTSLPFLGSAERPLVGYCLGLEMPRSGVEEADVQIPALLLNSHKESRDKMVLPPSEDLGFGLSVEKTTSR